MDTISKKIAEYFSDKSEITGVYLFGSHAVGKQRSMSDVDVGIVVDEDRVDSDDLAKTKERYLLDLSRLLRKDIHLVVLNRAGETLLSQVLKKGVCVLTNNKTKLAMFKAGAFLKIADFSYYKKLLQAAYVRNVMEKN